jgi:hypothetical protein
MTLSVDERTIVADTSQANTDQRTQARGTCLAAALNVQAADTRL